MDEADTDLDLPEGMVRVGGLTFMSVGGNPAYKTNYGDKLRNDDVVTKLEYDNE